MNIDDLLTNTKNVYKYLSDNDFRMIHKIEFYIS